MSRATDTPRHGVPEAAPAAQRHSRPGWRDPRIALGIALVACSVAGGARIVATADDTVAVWAMAQQGQPGSSITAEDLERRQVRFADQELADRYLPATVDLPEGAVLARGVGSGELLPREAVTTRSTVDLIEVPVSVEAGSLPLGLHRGAEVDVWLVPTDRTAGRGEESTAARRHLTDVVVLGLGAEAGEFSVTGQRQILIGVPATEEQQVARFLGGLAGQRVVVTRDS